MSSSGVNPFDIEAVDYSISTSLKDRMARELSMENYVLVGAIDFGTTYSGYACSFKSQDDSVIMYRDWGANMGLLGCKAPTCVLTDSNGKLVAFGYEAQERFAGMSEEEAKEHTYFGTFKMILHKTKDLTRDTMVRGTNGVERPALEIFSMVLEYLKEHLLDVVTRQTTQRPADHLVRWVVTVPAIWSDAAKQFMREAAYKAGLGSPDNPRQLLIALEPEVAALHCSRKNVDNFLSESQHQGETPSKDVRMKVGTEYLVLDCGGGTLDVTAYLVGPNNTLKQIFQANGGSLGGKQVDKQFTKLLVSVFGENVLKKFKEECAVGWLQMKCNFERKKKSIRPEGKGVQNINFEIPYELNEICMEVTGKSIKTVIQKCAEDGIKFASGMLSVSLERIQKLFKPVVNGIVDHVGRLLIKPQMRNINYILMVGGFSECPLLQQAIRESFGSKAKVLVPDDASLCVIKGAVAFGHNPNVITSRIARLTYGEWIDKPYDPVLYKRDKPRIKVYDGVTFQTGLFDTYVQKGTEISVGQVKVIKGQALLVNQNAIGHKLYCADKEFVKYADEEGVKYIGSWQTPLEGEGLDRQVEIRIFFGDTELFVQSRQCDSSDKEWVETKFEFLSDMKEK